MARYGLGWTLDDLALRSGVSRRTIAKFETGGNVLPDRVEALRQCFVADGVEFINGGKSIGVRVPRRD
jgi:transcriptional regulator with XRE-family HTH domain